MAVDRGEEHGFALRLQGGGAPGEPGRHLDALGAEELELADEHGAVVHAPGDAAGGDGAKIGDGEQRQRTGLSTAHDGGGERMLGGALDGGGQSEEFSGLEVQRLVLKTLVCDRKRVEVNALHQIYIGQRRPAFGERAGLVHDQP